ncbi:MAG: hypothetical protein H6733_15235 [Alphaproteobacteria bacterium]|nr:hypothetical protein [Alphaproteobacteria bacterium]
MSPPGTRSSRRGRLATSCADLITLARPRLLPFVLALPLLGFGWAHWDHALPATGVDRLPWLLAAWTALHAGTLWLNAALDRDEGPVLLGASVAPPRGVVGVGGLALGVAVVLGARAAAGVGVIAAVSAALAVAYSWPGRPDRAWKGHPVLGPLVNVVGYGVLSPWAGWWLADVTAGPRTVAVEGVVMAGVAGCYLAAQAWQGAEDRARGYRTLVAVAGPAATLRGVRLCLGVAFALAVGLACIGWLPRALLLALAPGWWAVDAHVRAWARRGSGGGPGDAVQLARRIGWTTVAVVVVATGVYVRDSLRGGPVAGLATEGGQPPPAAVRAPPARPGHASGGLHGAAPCLCWSGLAWTLSAHTVEHR